MSVFSRTGDFGCGYEGWTPIMKTNRNKVAIYMRGNSLLIQYSGDKRQRGLAKSAETKFPTYWTTSFSKICLGMKMANQFRFIVINKQTDSLHSLIADGKYRATSLGRKTWKKITCHKAVPKVKL